MRKLITALFLFIGLAAHAQLTFLNNKQEANSTKFEIKDGKTYLYVRKGYDVVLGYTWAKVPVLYDSADRMSKYKMTVTYRDNVANRTFEFHYTLYRDTQKYVAYLKQTIDFHDSRPTKVVEDNFYL